MDKHSTYDGTEKRWEDKTNVVTWKWCIKYNYLYTIFIIIT